MTVWVMLPLVIPASAQSPSASPISSPTRPRTLDARDRTDDPARMPPAAAPPGRRGRAPPRQARQPPPRVLCPDGEAEDDPRLGPDLVQQRRAPGAAGALPGGAHQPGPLRVGERDRDGGLGQAGDAGELGA